MSLKRQDNNLKLYEYNTVNLLSCMTLDIEHFHAAAHFKTPSLTSSEYAKAFESTIHES